MAEFSPYHNVNESGKTVYPPVLFATSTRDNWVHPAHARKMVKRLWDASDRAGGGEGAGKGDWPVHYYENIEGGHGGGG